MQIGILYKSRLKPTRNMNIDEMKKRCDEEAKGHTRMIEAYLHQLAQIRREKINLTIGQPRPLPRVMLPNNQVPGDPSEK